MYAIRSYYAYSVFLCDGFYVKPRLIKRIEDDKHQELYQSEKRKQAVLSPGTAKTMKGLLKDVVSSGTGKKAGSYNFV